MIDFSSFIIHCQGQLQPLLKISSPEELDNFNQKLRQISLSLGQLFPTEWVEWKRVQGILDTWEIVSKDAKLFLEVIDAFEFSEKNSDFFIYLGKEKKSFPLIDPVHFIKTNFYSQEDIFFYFLLGEIMLEENLITLQLYGAMAQVRGLEQN